MQINDDIHEYIRVKNQLPLVQCFRAVQNITLLIGGLLYAIHPISVLLALVLYFWFELALAHININKTLHRLFCKKLENDVLMWVSEGK